MREDVQLMIDRAPVRFTPDGEVFVLDAIRAVAEISDPIDMWKKIKRKYPEVMSSVSEYGRRNKAPVAVTDSSGWERIQDVLIDMLYAAHSGDEG